MSDFSTTDVSNSIERAEGNGSAAAERDANTLWRNQMDNCLHEIENLDTKAGNTALEIGDILIRARKIYKGHGNWIRWMAENLPFSVRYAQRLMKAADFRAVNAALVTDRGLTPSHLVILARLPDDKLVEFVQAAHEIGHNGERTKKLVTDMSKRELETAVRAYLRSISPEPGHSKTDRSNTAGKENTVDNVWAALDQAMSRALLAFDQAPKGQQGEWRAKLESWFEESIDKLTEPTETTD